MKVLESNDEGYVLLTGKNVDVLTDCLKENIQNSSIVINDEQIQIKTALKTGKLNLIDEFDLIKSVAKTIKNNERDIQREWKIRNQLEKTSKIYEVEILKPKAKQLLKDLEELNLIKIIK